MFPTTITSGLPIWLVVSTPLKNMKVNWDNYSQYMEKNVPNHQPAISFTMNQSADSWQLQLPISWDERTASRALCSQWSIRPIEYKLSGALHLEKDWDFFKNLSLNHLESTPC